MQHACATETKRPVLHDAQIPSPLRSSGSSTFAMITTEYRPTQNRQCGPCASAVPHLCCISGSYVQPSHLKPPTSFLVGF